MEIYENLQTAIPRTKQNMFISIILSFLITYVTNFIYSEFPNSIQAERNIQTLSKIRDAYFGENS